LVLLVSFMPTYTCLNAQISDTRQWCVNVWYLFSMQECEIFRLSGDDVAATGPQRCIILETKHMWIRARVWPIFLRNWEKKIAIKKGMFQLVWGLHLGSWVQWTFLCYLAFVYCNWKQRREDTKRWRL
jgi:hypothetical protein